MPQFATPGPYRPSRSTWRNAFYYQPVDGLPVHGSSGTYISAMQSVNASDPNVRMVPFGQDNWNAGSESYYFVDSWPANRPISRVNWSRINTAGSTANPHLYWPDLRQQNAVRNSPFAQAVFGLPDYAVNLSNGDRHAICWSESTGELLEVIGYSGFSAAAEAIVTWDLNSYTLPRNGAVPVGVVAACFPVAPLMFTYQDLLDCGASGDLGHMLGLSVFDYGTTFTWPARKSDGTQAGGVPGGTVFRLKSNFNLNSLPNNALKAVARTLQKYGAVIYDRNFTRHQLLTPNDPAWPQGQQDLGVLLGTLFPWSAFEAVNLSSVAGATDSISVAGSTPAIQGQTLDGDPATVRVELNASARLTVSATAAAPTARFTATPTTGMVPLTVTFDASSSVAADGGPVSGYAWDFGDGTTGSGRVVSHTYETPGEYTPDLTVTAGDGAGGFESVETLTLDVADLTLVSNVVSAGGRLWVAATQPVGDDLLLELDPLTGEVLRSTAVTGALDLPFSNVLSTDGTYIFRVRQGDDVRRYSVADPAVSPAVVSLSYTTVDAVYEAGFLWVAEDTPTPRILKIDPDAFTVAATITLTGYTEINALHHDGTSLWFASATERELVKINPTNGSVVGSLSFGAAPEDYSVLPNAIASTDAYVVLVYGFSEGIIAGGVLSESLNLSTGGLNVYAPPLIDEVSPLGDAWWARFDFAESGSDYVTLSYRHYFNPNDPDDNGNAGGLVRFDPATSTIVDSVVYNDGNNEIDGTIWGLSAVDGDIYFHNYDDSVSQLRRVAGGGPTATDSATETVTVGEFSPQPFATERFTEAIRYSHRAITRAELITPQGERFMLPVVEGNLTIDRRNQVWRTADITVGLDAVGTIERTAIDRLNVIGSDIALHAGIYYENDRIELVQVARLRIETFERKLSSATIQIAARDYAAMLEEHPITADYTNRLRNLDLVSAVALLVTDSLPYMMPGMTSRLMVGDGVPAWQVPADATFDGDSRLDTIVRWCEAAGVYFFNLPNGTFYLRGKDDIDPTVLTVSDGDGGVLIDANEAFSRLDLYNAVDVSFDAPEGTTTPVRAFVVDDDPASPTYWSGPFGRRVKQVSDVPAKTNAEASAAAVAKLNEAKGINRGLRITGLRYPTLIPGDSIDVELPAETSETHVVEAVTHNLSGATVEIETRFVS